MNKGNSKQEMLERFESMGIPTPVEPIKNVQRKAANPEMQSKMDQIRNGAMRGQYAAFIEKSEKVSAAPNTIPVPKVGKNPNEKTNNAVAVQGFSAKSNPQANMLENMMFGDSGSAAAAASYSTGSVGEYSAPTSDIRSRLRQRLENKESFVQENENYEYTPGAAGLTEAELTERIVDISTEVAKEISKKMIKAVLSEYAKRDGGLIFESKKVRKAEVVGKNKVKIGGKTYLLKPVSE